ncbi:hypothetical protein [Acinetobacter phage HFM1]|nr:hypothetical protein [Acinetobacter phage HFM1]
MEKPDFIEQLITYCFVIAIATFAGVVKAIRKYQKVGGSMSLKTLLIKACGDIVIAIFSGLMMFLWLQRGVASLSLTPEFAFYISIAAYMGGQAIDIFVAIWQAIHDKTRGVDK